MFSEILKIIPKLDAKGLADLERQLQSRFTRVAKSFGKGIANVFKGGGIAGIGLALIDKILNPLQEVKESIDKILGKSDDVATYASQFETTAGKLAKLVGLAAAAGLDSGDLYTLINKFQGAVSGYNHNPADPANSSVANYAGEKDIAEGFFKFIQALKEMPKEMQILVQEQVFGSKQILKMSDFLQQDFAASYKAIGADRIDTAKLSESIEGMAKLKDLSDRLDAARELRDYQKKAGLVSEGMVNSMGAAKDAALKKENDRLKSYENLAAISKTMDQVMMLIEEGLASLGGLIKMLTPMVEKMMKALDQLMKNPVMRSIKGIFGGKGD